MPPFSEIVSDTADPDTVVAAPLSVWYRDLPKMVKSDRYLKILRRMHEATHGTGCEAHYQRLLKVGTMGGLSATESPLYYLLRYDLLGRGQRN